MTRLVPQIQLWPPARGQLRELVVSLVDLLLRSCLGRIEALPLVVPAKREHPFEFNRLLLVVDMDDIGQVEAHIDRHRPIRLRRSEQMHLGKTGRRAEGQ